MSEFEKEFNNCLHFGFIPNEPQNKVIEHFKDWQPPKPIVKIPQFMADWFEYQLKNNNDLDKFDGNGIFRIIQDVIKVSNDESTWEDYGITDEIAKFAEDNEELFLNLIVNCSLGYGYTVKKEQMYEVVFYVDEEDDRCLLMKTGKTISFEYESQNEGHYQQKFKEEEIKSIDPRYWAFAFPV